MWMLVAPPSERKLASVDEISLFALHSTQMQKRMTSLNDFKFMYLARIENWIENSLINGINIQVHNLVDLVRITNSLRISKFELFSIFGIPIRHGAEPLSFKSKGMYKGDGVRSGDREKWNLWSIIYTH